MNTNESIYTYCSKSSFNAIDFIRDKMKKHFQLKIYYYYRKPGNKMAKLETRKLY